MEGTWVAPARTLVESLDGGLPALWSLAYAAQRGTLLLAQQVGTDLDLSLTLAAMDLGEALEELEWAHPELPAVSVALDLGSLPGQDRGSCADAIGLLLAGGLEVAAQLLRDPWEDLDTAEVLRVARVVHLLTNGHVRVAGRMP